ncbi:MAG: hypothetical protein KA248_03055 [Kiritimatiellae bacterium]|nr:hypothetical protein [Kiritimatiellia bacterium]
MKTKHTTWRRYFLFAMAALAIVAGPGCETDDHVDSSRVGDYFEDNPYTSLARPEADRYLRITPAEAEVTFIGQTVRFQVDGGTPPFDWTVALPAVGSIGSPRENEAIYTASAVEPNNVLVFDASGRSGVAAINGGLEPDTLTVSADPDTLLLDGGRAVVNVTGGVAPYRWSVQSGALGYLDRTSGESVVYTRSSAGDNSVRVTDSQGSTGAVVIQQPSATGGPLAASASPSVLNNNGDRATLTATGGLPPYRWYLQDAALGSLDTDGGASVTYTRNRPGDNSVRVTDANDDTVTVVIQQP